MHGVTQRVWQLQSVAAAVDAETTSAADLKPAGSLAEDSDQKTCGKNRSCVETIGECVNPDHVYVSLQEDDFVVKACLNKYWLLLHNG